MVKTFGKIGSCGSNNGKLAVTQTQSYDTFPPELIPGSTGVTVPNPTIASITSWQQIGSDVAVTNIPSPPSPTVVASGNNTDETVK